MTKALTLLTEPVALFWLLLLLVVAWRVHRRAWRHVVLPAGLAVLLCAAGITKLPACLLASLERPYAGVPVAQVAPADAVVMLGGVLSLSTNDAFGFQLSDAADRAVMAAELVRRGKARALVLGGGGHGPNRLTATEGELLNRWLTAWGFTNVPVYSLGACTNTRDEGEHTRKLARDRGWQRLILVTSAAHMKRAAGVFRQLGLPVTCVACDFQGLSSFEDPEFSPFLTAGGLEQLGAYVHEEIGWWVYRWRGWVAE